MTPKEKAFHLYFSFIRDIIADKIKAKQCALIAVDEILKEKKECSKYECYGNDLNYWQEVKQEIEKL